MSVRARAKNQNVSESENERKCERESFLKNAAVYSSEESILLFILRLRSG